MISLFQFQETAAANISSNVSEYLDAPARTTVDKKQHVAPFFQSVSAVTGAGKTVILAEAVSQISDTMPVKPVIMWLSRGKVVVRQTFANLSPGGKYHHLLDGMSVDALGNYKPEVVEEAPEPLVYFATVGTFNQKDKESGNLLIHQSDVDNMEASQWQAIQGRLDLEGNRRPLIIVYDEAQNLSDQQTELLLELEPDGFLLASATMRLPSRIGKEIEYIRTAGYGDEELVTAVKTPDVVAEGLIKDTILLEGYNTPMEEAVSQMVHDWHRASEEAENLQLNFRPKCIYVSNTNVVADTPSESDSPRRIFTQRQAPPILIWRYLVDQLGIDPKTIAVYADLKVHKDFPLPDEFVLFKGAETDFDTFSAGDYEHIIFNLTLQEGWDDPSVCFAYIDKSMGSAVQITQIIGRVLRQPGAQHYPAERLNSAHFYVRVDKRDVFNDVIEDVRGELGQEPGAIKVLVAAPGKMKPEDYPPKGVFEVPETALDPGVAQQKIASLLNSFPDYRSDQTNTVGVGSRRIVKQKVGESGTKSEWEEYEQSSEASARWLFHREVQRQYKWALGVVNLADSKLDARLGIGSPAQTQLTNLANDVVSAYLQSVRLSQRRLNPYRVGTFLARPDDVVRFENSVHFGYSDMNQFEYDFAGGIDKVGLPWARNPARSGYGIPLVTVGPTSVFYPDFLIWTEERVICVDTKGPHLIQETARRKLLRIRAAEDPPRLDVQFVSKGTYDDNLDQRNSGGFTSWGLGNDGAIRSTPFDEISDLVSFLTDDSQHQSG